MSSILRIEDTYGFDTLAGCHVLIHPIALPDHRGLLACTRVVRIVNGDFSALVLGSIPLL